MKLKIYLSGNQKAWNLSKKEIKTALEVASLEINRIDDFTINIRFTDDQTISRYHGLYLNDPSATDVITFPMEENDPENGDFILGELMVSHETALREAKKRKLTIKRELLLYIIHGFLHLNGYDDRTKNERKTMHQLQNKILAKL